MIQEEIIRLVVAAVLGALIGLDRERLDRGAGLRTHILVSTASALLIIVSAYGFADVLAPGRVELDPSRIAAQVVSGIGFIGAGTIILRKNAVRGLTTAASVWAVAAVGLAVGAGLYAAAVATTLILLVVLVGLRPIEHRFFSHKRDWRLTLHMRRQPGQLTEIEQIVRASQLHLRQLDLEPSKTDDERTMRIALRGSPADGIAALAERLEGVAGVRVVSYTGISATTRADDIEQARRGGE